MENLNITAQKRLVFESRMEGVLIGAGIVLVLLLVLNLWS